MLLSGERTGSYNSTNSVLDKEANSDENNNLVTMYSSSKDKIELFKSLFKGREDVCAKRWRNKSGYSLYCFNDFKTGLCAKPMVKCNACKNSNFAPLDYERIKNHLLGKYVLGLYPMTVDDTCYLLAIFSLIRKLKLP